MLQITYQNYFAECDTNHLTSSLTCSIFAVPKGEGKNHKIRKQHMETQTTQTSYKPNKAENELQKIKNLIAEKCKDNLTNAFFQAAADLFNEALHAANADLIEVNEKTPTQAELSKLAAIYLHQDVKNLDCSSILNAKLKNWFEANFNIFS